MAPVRVHAQRPVMNSTMSMQEPLQEPGQLKMQEQRICAASTADFDPPPPTIEDGV